MFGTLWPERLLFPTCLKCRDVVYLTKRPLAASRICQRCGAERIIPPAKFELWRSVLAALYLFALMVYGWVWLLLWPVRVFFWRPLSWLLSPDKRKVSVGPQTEIVTPPPQSAPDRRAEKSAGPDDRAGW